MNVRRGLLGLWVFASAIWIAGAVTVSAASDVKQFAKPLPLPDEAASQLPSCPPEKLSAEWNKCRGASTYPDGSKYVGEYYGGKFNGRGTYTYRHGHKYVGEFRDGKRNGRGTMAYPTGGGYVGEWHDDERSGQGTEVLFPGDKYVGEWRNDKRNGKGTLYSSDTGASYIGEFRDGQPDGQGTEILSEGSVGRSGIWSKGQFAADTAPSNAPSSAASSGGTEVSLVSEDGTFKVPVLINGVIALNFTVDSGAADVSIPADVVATLMRTETLRSDDFLGTQTYRLADGSTVPSKTFRIRSLKVGDKIIKNVTGSMASVQGSLLLGQSFLSRFGRVLFDYNRQVLLLE